MEYETLIAAFTEDLKLARRSPDTILTYPYTVRAFCKFIKGNILEVTKNDLKSYLSSMMDRGLKPSSVERHFVIISDFYKFLIYSEVYKLSNPVTDEFWERYLRPYKGSVRGQRKCPTTEEVKKLVHSILNARDLAIIVLMFKTGCRRKEISELDRQDVNLETGTIVLKETRKRTNRTVFIDAETIFVLRRYLNRRKDDNPALFLSYQGNRLANHPIDVLFKKYVKLAGLYKGERIEDKITPHCCRHWNGTALYNGSMRTEFIDYLRGDKGNTPFSKTYLHPDPQAVKAEYLRCIPNLGLT